MDISQFHDGRLGKIEQADPAKINNCPPRLVSFEKQMSDVATVARRWSTLW